MLLPFHDNNPTIRTPYVTVLLIVVNLLVLVWMIQLNPLQQEEVLVTRGFIPKRVKQLTNPNLVVEVKLDKVAFRLPAEQSSVYWSMFSTMFMHGGWMHLIGNMWFLWLFGNNIEDRLGHMLFLFFYIAGGLAATACHWAYDPDSTIPVVGASGAVAAVLGAYAVTYPWAKVKTLLFLIIFVTVLELPALVVLGGWFILQLVEAAGAMQVGLGGGGAGVAWWAHVGGFIVGAILMPILSAGTQPPGTDWRSEAAEQFGSFDDRARLR